jgi:membrane-bound lytic murein transglycosylase A
MRRSLYMISGKKGRTSILHTWFCPVLFSILFLSGCHPTLQKEALKPEEALVRVRFNYPNFEDDLDSSSLVSAMRENLRYLEKLDPERIFEYGGDRYPCRHVIESQKALLALIQGRTAPGDLNRALREGFLVYKATGRVGDPKALFTGYYEPTYEASAQPGGPFQFPLYKRPDDLVEIDLSPFKEELKGKSIIAMVAGKKVTPYFSRKDIEGDRVLAGKNLEIAWLRDPLDVAFLHIQGSGRLRLPDRSVVRVGYEAKNGLPYNPIGRYMIEKGFLAREEVSMQSIRRYLTDHPEVREEVLNHNPSYVFFRPTSGGPYGNINVPLTPGRSLALDTRLFPRGALCFIKTKKPVVDAAQRIVRWDDFSRFALNQDTGGAIKGAGRADVFWGDDEYAEIAAGHMRHEGELYVLIKKPEKK